ncbi:hypothetical protein [Burkholderia cepacia]|uniref:hypothetical protein n=1 Tax=Burkholderia cepacia TaxID=292 RepID=UPI001CF346B6|nr:hypothetical protein [Burkholderia cepacia]MCA8135670.1 hypothetical protein [Burkholderia cepacia]
MHHIFFSKSPQRAKQSADVLRDLLLDRGAIPPAEFHLQNAAAYVFGHPDFSAWTTACAETQNQSAFDEDCTLEKLEERRKYQAARLAEYAGQFQFELAAREIVDLWQPSAKRPEESALAYVQRAKWQKNGEDKRCLKLAQQLELEGRIPSEAEVELLRVGVRCARKDFRNLLETFVGALGCKLVNDYENRYAALGYRLLNTLQAASTHEFTYPRVSLAKAVAHGWGTPPRIKESARLKRAKSLLELVGQTLTERTWENDESYIEYFLTYCYVLKQPGQSQDLPLALEKAKAGAGYGNGPSARDVYNACRANQTALWRGVVAPDPVVAEEHRLMAVAAGMDAATERFPGEDAQ